MSGDDLVMVLPLGETAGKVLSVFGCQILSSISGRLNRMRNEEAERVRPGTMPHSAEQGEPIVVLGPHRLTKIMAVRLGYCGHPGIL